MADIEMPDAGPSVPTNSKSKAPVKSSKAGADGGGEVKKRFEVKKVELSFRSALRLRE